MIRLSTYREAVRAMQHEYDCVRAAGQDRGSVVLDTQESMATEWKVEACDELLAEVGIDKAGMYTVRRHALEHRILDSLNRSAGVNWMMVYDSKGERGTYDANPEWKLAERKRRIARGGVR